LLVLEFPSSAFGGNILNVLKPPFHQVLTYWSPIIIHYWIIVFVNDLFKIEYPHDILFNHHDTFWVPFFFFFFLPLKVLSISEVKGLSSPTSACKYLTLNKKINKWDLPGIASLLQSSPNLQKLTINLMPSNNFEVFFYHNLTSLSLFLSI
jgi:hypothetical protein